MAAALAERLLRERFGDSAPSVRSAGVFTGGGAPATPEAQDAVERLGGDLRGHRSQSLTPDMIRQAGAIYCMTMDHARAVLDVVPESRGRVFVLDPEGRDLSDPIGGPQELYDRTADRIEAMLLARIEEWTQ
jgi:protein-tyrosine phosphatase